MLGKGVVSGLEVKSEVELEIEKMRFCCWWEVWIGTGSSKGSCFGSTLGIKKPRAVVPSVVTGNEVATLVDWGGSGKRLRSWKGTREPIWWLKKECERDFS